MQLGRPATGKGKCQIQADGHAGETALGPGGVLHQALRQAPVHRRQRCPERSCQPRPLVGDVRRDDDSSRLGRRPMITPRISAERTSSRTIAGSEVTTRDPNTWRGEVRGPSRNPSTPSRHGRQRAGAGRVLEHVAGELLGRAGPWPTAGSRRRPRSRWGRSRAPRASRPSPRVAPRAGWAWRLGQRLAGDDVGQHGAALAGALAAYIAVSAVRSRSAAVASRSAVAAIVSACATRVRGAWSSRWSRRSSSVADAPRPLWWAIPTLIEVLTVRPRSRAAR